MTSSKVSNRWMKRLEFLGYLAGVYLLGHVIYWGLVEHFEVKTIKFNPDRGWSTPFDRAEEFRKVR